MGRSRLRVSSVQLNPSKAAKAVCYVPLGSGATTALHVFPGVIRKVSGPS